MSSEFATIKRTLPKIGIGLGLRREIAFETFENAGKIDWLELVPENYMKLGGMARERLETAGDLFPLVSHGINLSIGSTDDLNYEYLDALKELLDSIDSPWWSDHLCFTTVNNKYMHDLLPLPFTREAVKHIAQRIKRVQDYVGRPFLVENISYYMNMPGCEMSDAQFLAEVLETADCGLMLDVNNVYVNSLNHKFDAVDYLKQLPLDRTVQMHVAGHKRIGDYIIDTHGAAVVEPVYELLRYVLQNTTVHAVLLERDQNFPEFSELIAELEQIRNIAKNTQPDMLPSSKLAAFNHNGRGLHRTYIEEEAIKGGRDLRAFSA